MKILIVDDNEDSRIILKKSLESDGHTVQIASNGSEALSTAKESPPDMFISDILMPVMDGFRLCREVKQDEQLKKVPFIFYTATYLDPKDEKLALSLGASRFIVKPIETAKFLNVIKEVFQEYKDKKLQVPESLLTDTPELLRMYEESVSKKLDEKVRELQLYKEIFVNANDAIMIIDAQGFYIKQNSAHRALMGYTDEELRGKTPAIHLGEEVFANMLSKLSKQSVYRDELISYTKTGKAVYIELSAFAVANEKGGVSCYVGISRDITRRKKMEEELRERVEELETFYESAIGRELRMKELKEEIQRLKSELAQYRGT